MKVETRIVPIQEKLSRYLTPKYGNCVYVAGGKGMGKTHEIVNYIYHFTVEMGWKVITNIQFDKIDNLPPCPECGKELDVDTMGRECIYCGYEDEEGEAPPGVYFVNKMTDFWKSFGKIRLDEPYTPVVFIVDEFHETVNRLESHKYWNIVTGLVSWQSQMRKFTQSAMFCSQWLTQIPKDPRNYAEYFMVKTPVVANQITIDGDFKGPRYTSFIVPVQSQEVKILDQYGNIKYIEAKKFRVRHLNNNLDDLIKHKIISDVFISFSCPYNDVERGEWQYKHKGVSKLTYDQIDDDQGYWFRVLVQDLGEVGDDKVGKTILNFFETYKAEDQDEDEEEFKVDLKDGGIQGWFDWKLSTKTQSQAAEDCGTTARTIRRAEERLVDMLSEAEKSSNRTDGQGGGDASPL